MDHQYGKLSQRLGPRGKNSKQLSLSAGPESDHDRRKNRRDRRQQCPPAWQPIYVSRERRLAGRIGPTEAGPEKSVPRVISDQHGTGQTMILKRFYEDKIAQASFLLGDSGEAVIIDPNRNIQPYMDAAAAEGL